MLTLLKLLQSMVRALHSEGTPEQVAAGIALGSALGLTPLLSLHNLLVVGAVALLRVSVPGAMLGWLVAIPFGFLLDPVFDTVGRALLLQVPFLQAVWGEAYNTPVLSLSRFNNSVVLGSLVSWMVLAFPIYLGARWGVARYRATVHPKVVQWRVVKAARASKLYNLYRLFHP
jgi:uncharacterized protein (TIGR03546 family)